MCGGVKLVSVCEGVELVSVCVCVWGGGWSRACVRVCVHVLVIYKLCVHVFDLLVCARG